MLGPGMLVNNINDIGKLWWIQKINIFDIFHTMYGRIYKNSAIIHKSNSRKQAQES